MLGVIFWVTVFSLLILVLIWEFLIKDLFADKPYVPDAWDMREAGRQRHREILYQLDQQKRRRDREEQQRQREMYSRPGPLPPIDYS